MQIEWPYWTVFEPFAWCQLPRGMGHPVSRTRGHRPALRATPDSYRVGRLGATLKGCPRQARGAPSLRAAISKWLQESAAGTRRAERDGGGQGSSISIMAKGRVMSARACHQPYRGPPLGRLTALQCRPAGALWAATDPCGSSLLLDPGNARRAEEPALGHRPRTGRRGRCAGFMRLTPAPVSGAGGRSRPPGPARRRS